MKNQPQIQTEMETETETEIQFNPFSPEIERVIYTTNSQRRNMDRLYFWRR